MPKVIKKSPEELLKLRVMELDILEQLSKTFWSTFDGTLFSEQLLRLLSGRLDMGALLFMHGDSDNQRLIVTSKSRISPKSLGGIQSTAFKKFTQLSLQRVNRKQVTSLNHVISSRESAKKCVGKYVHVLPLTVLDTTHGFLGFASDTHQLLGKEDLRFLTIVANEVAMVASNRSGQNELARERNLLVSILHSMTCALLVVDTEQRVVMSNPLANAIFGIDAKRIAGRKITEVVEQKSVLSLFASASSNANEYLSRDIEIPNAAQGRPMIARANLAKVRAPGGRVVGVVMVLNDISREKEVELARTEFVSVASHELRTPMAAIREAVSLVMEGITGPVNDKQHKFLDMAQRNIDRLTNIINDLLDLSKIESGKFSLTRVSITPTDIIEETFTTFEAAAHDKGISLLKQIAPKLPKLTVDRDKMAQVLGNLVSNAIKFTPKGGMVTIGSRLTAGREKSVEFYVQDTGIGIDHKDFGKLFQKFQQIDSSLSKAAGGTGLGLAISKEIVELHGGRIWVESEPGRGSTFRLVVPINPAKAVRKRYVLTVSSDRELDSLVASALHKDQFEVAHVFKGRDVEKSVQEMRPDLIMLDMRIPDMDGYDLCRKLKESPQTALIPIVILTPAGQESVVWKALSLGVNGYLVQPVDANAILSTVREVMP